MWIAQTASLRPTGVGQCSRDSLPSFTPTDARCLLVALIGAVIAGAFGFGAAKHMSPYGADDPATQSVQATNRFEAAAGRKIDPGIVAIVDAGDVRTPAVRRRVDQVAASSAASLMWRAC